MKHQHDIGWQHQRLGRVRPGIIQQDQIQGVRVGLGEIVQKPLHHHGRESGKLHEMARAAAWFHRPERPRILEAVLVHPDRFDGPCGNPSSVNGMESESTLITGPHAHGLLVRGRNGSAELSGKVGREVGYGCCVFLGLVGRGTLRLAPSL